MKVTLLQTDLKWEDKQYNRNNIQFQIEDIGETDLIVLPEMFTTGFTMKPQNLSETMDGETIGWMSLMSLKTNAAICGSIIIEENGKYYNRFIWVQPDGTIKHYDKRHLFSYAGEDKNYTPGNERIIIDYKGFRICPQICYDLRFPVFSRNTGDYDILLYVANWPSIRSEIWTTLLTARAIENQCYIIAVNRIGKDGNELEYNGKSTIINPMGISSMKLMDKYWTNTGMINKDTLNNVRNAYPFLKDGDKFKLV
jgi:predicted amidohydrolase